jgi:uncharacterized protein YbjT (DUF2867 family)
MIFVTGATGRVGRRLVDVLLAGGVKVRALTRDPGATGLPAAAEVVSGDTADADAFADMLEGVSALFVNPAATGESVPGLLAAARNRGVRRVVLLSFFAVRGTGEQVYSIGTAHRKIERAVEASGLEWTFLRCGGFAANSLGWAPQIRAGGVVRAPYGRAATAPIGEQDIAAAAARVLLDDGHAGAAYVLTGQESLTQIEQVRLIGEAIGRELRFEELPADAFRKAAAGHMPAPAVEDLLRYYSQYIGRTAEMSADVQRLTGRPATKFADWAAGHAAGFR